MGVLRHIPVGLLVLCTAAVVWRGLLLPPPGWILKYGLTLGCEPTGRTWNIEGVEFVEIGRGISRMGSNWLARNRMDGCSAGDVPGRLARPVGIDCGEAVVPSDEMPVHWTDFPRPFAVARREIPQETLEHCDPEFARFRGYPSPYLGIRDRRREPASPAAVGRDDALRFCRWLSEKSGFEVRLPREDEWECACRAGTTTEWFFGDDESELSRYGFCGDSRYAYGTPFEREPNPWGFFNSSGNADERCEDPYGAGSMQVIRGGNGASSAIRCRSASRQGAPREVPIGFRPAFTPPDR